eukprot:2964601-Pleurochrysis_carterae.AAC.1
MGSCSNCFHAPRSSLVTEGVEDTLFKAGGCVAIAAVLQSLPARGEEKTTPQATTTQFCTGDQGSATRFACYHTDVTIHS